MADKLQVLYVTWKDHGSGVGWRTPDELDIEPLIIHSIGFKLKEDKHHLVLGISVDPRDMNSTARQYIMKSAIIERRRVPLKSI